MASLNLLHTRQLADFANGIPSFSWLQEQAPEIACYFA
jgi:hypothetical protein